MAGTVTELMVKIEYNMSQGLMNKRMEIKDTSLEKKFMSKDLETQEELLRKVREERSLQAEKLKQARAELSFQEVELLKLKHSEVCHRYFRNSCNFHGINTIQFRNASTWD